jgi:hypothetical protein
MTRERGQWLIGRHFGVLACMAAALILFGRWRSMGPLAAFAVYGALHALAIVVSLRNPQPLSRKLRFIAFAAALAVVSTALGLRGSTFLGALSGLVGPPLLLAVSAGFGAASYGMLLKAFWFDDLSPRTIALIVLGCVAATTLALETDVVPKTADGLWLALPWWFAFSLGLWCHDYRTQRTIGKDE